ISVMTCRASLIRPTATGPRRRRRSRILSAMAGGGQAQAARSEGAAAATTGSQIVLLTLAAGQFLMVLDSSVMNVSIATIADDLGTTVTGIQGAITAYTLVMAALM